MRSRFAIAFSLLILAACRGPKTRTIAVIPKGTAHLFWVSVEAGAMSAGKQFGVEVLWNGPAMETDYDRQIQIMDSMIARRVDGIALAVTEKTALIQPVERAAAQGIPVTVFDSGVDTSNYVTFIATDNYEGGRIAATELGRLTGGKGSVAMVMNAPGSLSTMDRERGFEETIAREFPGMHTVGRQYGLSDPGKARAAAENILTAHPEIVGIFASAEPSSVGTALALRSRGLAGKIHLIAFDSSDTMVTDLKEGVIAAMVVQDPFQMGFEAVKSLVDKLDGRVPPKRMDLHARLIRKADLDNPEVMRLLKPK